MPKSVIEVTRPAAEKQAIGESDVEGGRGVSGVRWWLGIVGAFYMLQFVAVALVRAPIRAQAPADTLARNAAGDPLAMFLVDTWVTFGLEMAAIGVGLLVATRAPDKARPLIWTILAIEVSRGIITDLYMIARGHDLTVPLVWIVIHGVVFLTGLRCLSRLRSQTHEESASEDTRGGVTGVQPSSWASPIRRPSGPRM